MKSISLKNFLKLSSVLVFSFIVFGANADIEDKHHHGKTYKAKSQSAKNEALVVKFYNRLFNERADIERTAKRFLPEDYIQHNAFVGTGRQNFIVAIGNLLANNPDMKFEIKRVMTDGDLVILFVHMHIPGSDWPGEAIMEMMRVKDGKIVEHWDVQQAIPEHIPHDNGVF